MDIITLTHDNLENEHICCAIANNKDCQVISKKSWLAARLDEGLVFKKLNARGKCFIEYIPAEYAWVPIEAQNYMYIDCLWVSGQFKGKGFSNELLEECIKDSKQKKKSGLVVLSSKKKLPFLSDPKYLEYKGFKVADTAEPSYELMYLPFSDDASIPCFKAQAKCPHIDKKGYILYYTQQCPFTAKYVPLAQQIAKDRGIEFEAIRFENCIEAQNAPAPVTTYSLFYNGELLTHEIMSEKMLNKLFDSVD